MDNNLITHNPSLGVFTVLGTSGNPQAVRLFPKESCSCPSTTQCYHILAAKMSIGLENVACKRKINLTQLRRNTRPKSHKKSGRKAPQPNDYEVLPAPDCTQEKDLQESMITHALSGDVKENVQVIEDTLVSNAHVPMEGVMVNNTGTCTCMVNVIVNNS